MDRRDSLFDRFILHRAVMKAFPCVAAFLMGMVEIYQSQTAFVVHVLGKVRGHLAPIVAAAAAAAI